MLRCCFASVVLHYLLLLTCCHLFGPPWRDIFNNKDIGKAEGEPQPLLGIPLIKAVKARAAAYVELPNNSIEDSEEVLALIKGNGGNIYQASADHY